jgi:hypothetical protein
LISGIGRAVLAAIAALGASVVFAANAGASIAPHVTLTQSGLGFTTSAGATSALGADLSFTPSAGDSVKDFLLELPPGLLGDAALDGGACVTGASLTAACSLGSATIDGSQTDGMYLVRAPAPGDFAGVAVGEAGQAPLLTAGISMRGASSPLGVGLDIAAAGIPPGVGDLDVTFSALRMPDRCPSTPARVMLVADSQLSATKQTTSAPLQVTNCSALQAAYQPRYQVVARKDAHDSGVAVESLITEGAGEETTGAITLAIPSDLRPNAIAAAADLCLNASLSSCQAVGTATATSPLLAGALAGQVYLTQSLLSPELTVDFPSVGLVMSGTVSITNETVAFAGVPDFPLTRLGISLSGGSNALFFTSCAPSSDTAKAKFVDQNGDKTVNVSAAFTIGGCARVGRGGGGTGGTTHGKPTASRKSLSGLSKGKAMLSFRLSAGSHAPALRSVTVKLPPGLSFVGARLRRRVTIAGAKLRSANLIHGRLVLTLKKAAASFTVRLAPAAIRVSRSLERKAKRHRIRSLAVDLWVVNAANRRTALTMTFHHPG